MSCLHALPWEGMEVSDDKGSIAREQWQRDDHTGSRSHGIEKMPWQDGRNLGEGHGEGHEADDGQSFGRQGAATRKWRKSIFRQKAQGGGASLQYCIIASSHHRVFASSRHRVFVQSHARMLSCRNTAPVGSRARVSHGTPFRGPQRPQERCLQWSAQWFLHMLLRRARFAIRKKA